MKKKTKGLWIAWLLVLPVVIVRAFTTLYPIIMTFINSTYDMSLLKGNNFQFIGLENYLRIFEDQKLLSSIGFTVKFTVVSMFFHLVLGVILALMLNMKIKGKKFLRTIVLIPWAMPMVVAGLAARWAFNDQYGLINDLIRRFVPNFHYDWLVHANSAQGAVIAVDLWKDLPFFAILVLAALQFLSADIYEAAKIDGATKWQTLTRVTIPNIMPSITICLFLTITNGFKLFDQNLALTNGQPFEQLKDGSVIKTTEMLALNIYNTFYGQSLTGKGVAQAKAVIFFILVAGISIIQLKATRSKEVQQ